VSSAAQFLQKDLGGQLLVVFLPLEFCNWEFSLISASSRIPPPWPRRDIQLIPSRSARHRRQILAESIPTCFCAISICSWTYNVQLSLIVTRKMQAMPICVYLFVIVKEISLCICLFLVFSCAAAKLTRNSRENNRVIESYFSWQFGTVVFIYLKTKFETFHHVWVHCYDRQVFSLSPCNGQALEAEISTWILPLGQIVPPPSEDSAFSKTDRFLAEPSPCDGKLWKTEISTWILL